MRNSNLPFAVAGILAVVAIILAVVFNAGNSGKLSDAQDDITALKSQITSLQSQLTTQLNTMDQKISTQSTQTTDTNSQVTTLKAKVEADAATLAALQGQIKTANDAVAAVKDQLTLIGTQITSYQNSTSGFNTKISDMETKLAAANTTIATLQNTVNNLQTQVTALQSGGYTNVNLNFPYSTTVSASPAENFITNYNNTANYGYIYITGYASGSGAKLRIQNNSSGTNQEYDIPLTNTTFAVNIYYGVNTIYLKNTSSSTITVYFSNVHI